MDITEMQKLRADYERDISNAVGKAVSEFQARTGLRVDSVSIDVFPVTAIGAPTTSVVSGARLLINV